MQRYRAATITAADIKKNLEQELQNENIEPDIELDMAPATLLQAGKLLNIDSSDSDFIEHCYEVILCRSSDAHGKANLLNKLVNDKISREEIVCRMRLSAEGRRQKVKLPGIYLAAMKSLIYHIPIFSTIFKRLEFIYNGSRRLHKVQNMQSEILQNYRDLCEQQIQIKAEITERFTELNDCLQELKDSQQELKDSQQELKDSQQELKDSQQEKNNEFKNTLAGMVESGNESNKKIQNNLSMIESQIGFVKRVMLDNSIDNPAISSQPGNQKTDLSQKKKSQTHNISRKF